MSSSVLPNMASLGIEWTRTPTFQTRKQKSISGKVVRIRDQQNPLYTWELNYSALRQGTIGGTAFTEFSQLEGFFETLGGGFDSFLYTDPDDNASGTDYQFGVGDGTTAAFQLARNFGGNAIPILAPNVVTNVKVSGTLQTLGTAYTVSTWGATTPGVITFQSGHIPAAAAPITWTGTFYFPCSFDDDSLTFKKFLGLVYELQKLSFTSIK